jgi:hypothetical protein
MNEICPLFFLEYDIIEDLMENRKYFDMTIFEYDILTKTFYVFIKPCKYFN